MAQTNEDRRERQAGSSSTHSPEVLKKTKEAALNALEANQSQQVDMIAYIQRLRQAIETANELTSDAERFVLNDNNLIIEGEEKTAKRIEVPGAIRLKPNSAYLTHSDSPFFGDSQQRMRYLSMTTHVPWTPTEKSNLRLVVIAEQKRLLAIKLKNENHPEPLEAIQAHEDSYFAELEPTNLDWERIGSRLSSIQSSGSTKRSAADCRVQWIGCGHPRINNAPWTEEELAALTSAVRSAANALTSNDPSNETISSIDLKVPKVDWSEISRKLGGSRTPAECLRRWISPSSARARALITSTLPIALPEMSDLQSKEHNGTLPKPRRRAIGPLPDQKRPWTEEEDEALQEAVLIHGRSNWVLVAAAIPYQRTPRQCSDRYRRSLDPNIRRTRWTNEEDTLLCQAVEVHGTSWSKVKHFIPGRTGPQCRERWVNVLDPNVRKCEWTEEEDARLLIAKSQNSNEWRQIAAIMGNRTDNQCSRRWRLLIKQQNQTSNNEHDPLSDNDGQATSSEAQNMETTDKDNADVTGQSAVDCTPTEVEPLKVSKPPKPRRKKDINITGNSSPITGPLPSSVLEPDVLTSLRRRPTKRNKKNGSSDVASRFHNYQQPTGETNLRPDKSHPRSGLMEPGGPVDEDLDQATASSSETALAILAIETNSKPKAKAHKKRGNMNDGGTGHQTSLTQESHNSSANISQEYPRDIRRSSRLAKS